MLGTGVAVPNAITPKIAVLRSSKKWQRSRQRHQAKLLGISAKRRFRSRARHQHRRADCVRSSRSWS